MQIKKGTIDVTLYFHLRASADGTSKTGLVYNSAGAVASYVRTRGTRTAISLATLAAADSAHADGGFKEVDGTNAKGLYRLDVADAAFASGVDEVIIHIGFTDAFDESLAVELVDERSGNLAASQEVQLNAQGKLDVNAEADTALSDIKLDHLIAVADADDPVDDSIIAKLTASDGDWSGFDKATDALEAIRDRGDSEWGGDAATIADAVWDELQSGHVDAGSFGKYLDTEISGIAAAIGSGLLSCTWTQKDGSGNPMDNVQIWITTDEAGSNVVAGALYTNTSGEATFMLDAGTYYVWREKGGYNFTNPQSWTVS